MSEPEHAHVMTRDDAGAVVCACGWHEDTQIAPLPASEPEPETAPAGPGEAWQDQPENTGWDDTDTGPA